MKKKIRAIALFPKDKDKGAYLKTQELAHWLLRQGIKVFVPHTLTAKLPKKVQSIPREEIPKNVDLVCVLGGDGTLLNTARLVSPYHLPILGINMGELGFITQVSADKMYESLMTIFSKGFHISKRTMIDADVFRDHKKVAQYTALNDVVINKGALARIIELETAISGQFVSSVRADGMIISTPTGSTAYSLAAGGPIIHPKTPCLVITPICPHALTNRPLIIPDNSRVSVTLLSTNGEVILTIDGQVGFSLRSQDRIEVKKARIKTHLVHSPQISYLDILRSKLNLGKKIR